MLRKFALFILLTCCYAIPPPGYVKPPETDKYPPKYEYGYTIQDNKGSGQGKLETREGVFSLGRYYVQLGGGPKGASQNVQYITDEWGYHPFVEYSTTGDHSQTSTSFALGEKAVEALRNNARENTENKNLRQPTTLPAPNPTQSTNLPQVTPIKPTPTAAPSTPSILQTVSVQPTKIQFQNRVQETVPLFQNTIPMQYYFQPFGLPQGQYLIQPQLEQQSSQQLTQNLPQPQFLIQDQNIPPTQFIIPLYQNALDQIQKQGLENILSTQQPNLGQHQQVQQEQQQRQQQQAQQDLHERQQHQQVQQDQHQQQHQAQQDLHERQQHHQQQQQQQAQQDLRQRQQQQHDLNERQQQQDFHERQQHHQVQQQQAQQELHERQQQQHDLNEQQQQQDLHERQKQQDLQEQQQQQHQQQIEIIQQVEKEVNTNRQKISFLPKEVNQNNVLATQTPQYPEVQNNHFYDSQNNQYLIEIKPETSNNPQPTPQNVVLVTHNSGEQFLHQNNHIIESSTARYIEEHKQENKEIENFVQAIQNDIHLQNTEPLFGNAASEVRYTNLNSISSNTKNDQYDESILSYENPGGYGARIKAKKIDNSGKTNQDNNIKLIDRTKNLVTGVDVLNINDAATEYGPTSVENSVEKQNETIPQVYGFNENVPNTILEAVTNYNNKNSDNKNVLVGSLITTGSLEIQSENHQNNLITSSSTYSAQNVENSRNQLLKILNLEKVQDDHISLSDQPIIVADFEENNIQASTERFKEDVISDSLYSTTQNTIETKITSNSIRSTETPILITPRPVSNNFLAPITAALSLQDSESDFEQLKKEIGEPESSVEIQKSVPYYLGKIESYESSQQSQSESEEEEALSTKLFVIKNNENESVEEGPKAEALIQTKSHNSLDDQKTEQGQISELKQNLYEVSEELNESDSESNESKVENKPIEITKYVDKPYPVEVPIGIGIPYPVEKQIPIEVERIVPVSVPIPQPYKVEVERIVEKHIKVPYEVTKYVDKPYPVHIPYPQPIAIPVEVERLVQTIVKEPYPVAVEVPIEVPVKIPVPHPVQITKYVDKPYPVEKIVEKPYPVEKIIEKPVTKYIDKPYPVPVHVPVPHPVAVPVEIKIPQPYPVEVTKYIDKPYNYHQPHKVKLPYKKPHQVQHHYQQYAHQYAQPIYQHSIQPHQHSSQNQHHQQTAASIQHPVTKLVQIPAGPASVEVPKYYERPLPLHINYQQQLKPNPYSYAPQYQIQIDWKNILNNCYLKHGKQLSDNRFVKIPDYVGLVPPQKPKANLAGNHENFKRKPRNSFEQNLRMEYGFKPPLIPSVQTDEFGMPLHQEEK